MSETYPRARLQRSSEWEMLENHDIRIRALEESLPPGGASFPLFATYEVDVFCGDDELDPTDGSFTGSFVHFGTEAGSLVIGKVRIQLGPDVGTSGAYFFTNPVLGANFAICGFGMAQDVIGDTRYEVNLDERTDGFYIVVPGTEPDGSTDEDNSLRPNYPWDVSAGDTIFDGVFVYGEGEPL